MILHALLHLGARRSGASLKVTSGGVKMRGEQHGLSHEKVEGWGGGGGGEASMSNDFQPC